MQIFIIAWILGGLANWIHMELLMPFPLGFIGSFLLGLPICLILGPLPMLKNYYHKYFK